MKPKSRILIVAVMFVVSASLLIGSTYRSGTIESVAHAGQSRSCLSRSELSLTLQAFSSTQDLQELEAARLRLMDNAALSTKCRTQVIDAIIEAMDKPQLDVYRDFNLWRYGSDLLGELKATESLDLLIRHLSFTDGGSINVTHYPAMVGVMKIGRPAVRKLGAALRQNSDLHYRYNSVFCIAQIGGPAAKGELELALPSESDSCLRKFIQTSIEALSNPKSPGQIALKDRDAWFAALSCKE